MSPNRMGELAELGLFGLIVLLVLSPLIITVAIYNALTKE